MEMKLVKVAKPKTEYMTYIENQIKDFKSHVHRMKTLYEQITVFKDHLNYHIMLSSTRTSLRITHAN